MMAIFGLFFYKKETASGKITKAMSGNIRLQAGCSTPALVNPFNPSWKKKVSISKIRWGRSLAVSSPSPH